MVINATTRRANEGLSISNQQQLDCLTAYSLDMQRNIKAPNYWPIVTGNNRWPMYFITKGKTFPCHGVIHTEYSGFGVWKVQGWSRTNPLNLWHPCIPFVIVENTSISRISNTDIDNTEEPGSYDLRDIAKCSTIPCENIPPSAPTGDEQINNIHVSRDVPKSRQLVLPYSLNIHIHPFGIVNPKNHCYLNSVIQLLLPILRTISYDFQFNSSTEGTLSKYMLETAYNAYSSTDVDVLKFQLVQYNQFYDGKNQQDSSECLLMLIEIINKGSVPYYGSHVSNSTGVFLSDILFSFMLEKYIVCNVCGLRSPSIESSGVLYISPTHTSSMQELIMQGLQQKLEKSCFRCNKNTWHVESNHILQPPNYLIIVVNRFRYINNQFTKDKCSIPMDMTVVLGYHKFSLQATIDHHGPSIYSGHYTTSVNCCNRTFYCNDNKITEFDMINTKNSSTAYVVIYKLIT